MSAFDKALPLPVQLKQKLLHARLCHTFLVYFHFTQVDLFHGYKNFYVS